MGIVSVSTQPAQLELAEGGLRVECGPQDFCPPARVRAEGGSCSAANGVPMVNRLYADCADI